MLFEDPLNFLKQINWFLENSESEQFPGLIFRQDKPKVTYLIFHSGKIVIAGSKSLEDLDKVASKIKEIIDNY